MLIRIHIHMCTHTHTHTHMLLAWLALSCLTCPRTLLPPSTSLSLSHSRWRDRSLLLLLTTTHRQDYRHPATHAGIKVCPNTLATKAHRHFWVLFYGLIFGPLFCCVEI